MTNALAALLSEDENDDIADASTAAITQADDAARQLVDDELAEHSSSGRVPVRHRPVARLCISAYRPDADDQEQQELHQAPESRSGRGPSAPGRASGRTGTRCTMFWSAPWLAIVTNAPPIRPGPQRLWRCRATRRDR